MIHTAICDDNISFTEYIETILLQVQSLYEMRINISIFYSGESFCKAIEKSCSFDIVLMDIEMEGMNGVRAGEILRSEDDNDKVYLIYISNHDTYWKQLFNVQPYAFLEKPLEDTVLIDKINKLIKKILVLRNEGKRKVLPIKLNGQEVLIPLNKIMYLESQIRKVTVYTVDEIIEYYSTLNKEENKLDSKEFVRTHQSYIINLRFAKKITNEYIILLNNTEIPISNGRKGRIKNAYLEYRRNYFE